MSLKIYEDKEKLNYEVGRTNMFWCGPAEPFIDQEAPWFVWVDSPRSRSPRAIWIVNGRDHLFEIAYDPAGNRDDYWGTVLRDADSSPWLVTDAPKAVRGRLPESFKKRFRTKTE